MEKQTSVKIPYNQKMSDIRNQIKCYLEKRVRRRTNWQKGKNIQWDLPDAMSLR